MNHKKKSNETALQESGKMSNVKIDSISSEVMKELEKYADVITEK